MTESQGGSEPTPEDEELLEALRAVLRQVEPLPGDLTAVARSLLSWRDPDARLAELTADSRELAGAVRGDTDVVLHFRADAVEIAVQLSPVSGGTHRLIGQVEPATPGTIRIRRAAEQVEVRADNLGRFVAEQLPPGPISLRWSADGDDGEAVETAWQLL
jgi:hypothetical protein